MTKHRMKAVMMVNNTEKGKLLVVSGPSGVGKGTVIKELFSMSDDFCYSISATTRDMRDYETNGVEYFFKTKEEFEEMIDTGLMLEYAIYNGEYYGTPADYVNSMLEQGKNVILEIEVQGALKVKKIRPEAIMIFVAPESKEILKERLKGRGTESEEIIASRIAIAERELRACLAYDYITVNRQNGTSPESVKKSARECACDIMAIIRAEKLKSKESVALATGFIL